MSVNVVMFLPSNAILQYVPMDSYTLQNHMKESSLSSAILPSRPVAALDMRTCRREGKNGLP